VFNLSFAFYRNAFIYNVFPKFFFDGSMYQTKNTHNISIVVYDKDHKTNKMLFYDPKSLHFNSVSQDLLLFLTGAFEKENRNLMDSQINTYRERTQLDLPLLRLYILHYTDTGIHSY
jgi:hypothetical protein